MKQCINLLVLGCMLAGCASQDEGDDSYVGWVCNGARNSDDWSCEIQEIHDGEPIVRELVANSGKDGAASAGKSVNSQPVIEIAGIPSQDWRKQLPSLSSDPVIVQSSPEAGPASLSKRPPRVPEPVTAVVSPQAEKLPTAAADVPVVHTIAEPVQPLNAVDVSGTRSGYTLQLGAFAGEPELQTFVAAHHLGSLEVRQFHSFSKEKHWQVLTWGEFESPEAARRAWRAIADRYPGIEPWVRSLGSLDNAAASAASLDG